MEVPLDVLLDILLDILDILDIIFNQFQNRNPLTGINLSIVLRKKYAWTL